MPYASNIRAAGDAVVHEHVHQRMPHPGALRALVVPEDLLGDLACCTKRRRTGAPLATSIQVRPSATKRSATSSRMVCPDISASRPPPKRAQIYSSDPRAGARGVRRNLIYNRRTNGAISHSWRVARACARGDSRRHPGRPAARSGRDYARPSTPAGWVRPRAAHGDRIGPCRVALRRPRRRDDRRPDRDDDREPRLAELAVHDARRARQGTQESDPPIEGGGARRAPVTRPRPGHADLAGAAKYGRSDVRDVLERASARETAARVAAGAIAKQLLARAGASITSHVFVLGEAALPAGRSSASNRRLPCPTTARCAASTPTSSGR